MVEASPGDEVWLSAVRGPGNMDIKINSLQPVTTDPKLVPEFSNKRSRVIKPIAKSKKALPGKVGDDRRAKHEPPILGHLPELDDSETHAGGKQDGDTQSFNSAQEMNETVEGKTALFNEHSQGSVGGISVGNRAQESGNLQGKKGVILDAKI